MRGFSFKNETFVILIACLIWLSTSATSNATTTAKYRRHTSGHHHVHIRKSKPNNGLKFNVLDYGAKGDGKSDDTKAFQAAWVNACKADASMIIVPSGYKFLVGPTSFSGSNCHKNIVFQVVTKFQQTSP
ncbi:putative endo-polygalacturonase [Helianthus anomalus]